MCMRQTSGQLNTSVWGKFPTDFRPDVLDTRAQLRVLQFASGKRLPGKVIEKRKNREFWRQKNDCSNEKGTDPQRIMGK